MQYIQHALDVLHHHHVTNALVTIIKLYPQPKVGKPTKLYIIDIMLSTV